MKHVWSMKSIKTKVCLHCLTSKDNCYFCTNMDLWRGTFLLILCDWSVLSEAKRKIIVTPLQVWKIFTSRGEMKCSVSNMFAYKRHRSYLSESFKGMWKLKTHFFSLFPNPELFTWETLLGQSSSSETIWPLKVGLNLFYAAALQYKWTSKL